MRALFPKWTNTGLRLALVLLIASVPATLLGLLLYVRTPWNTDQFVAVDQPVEFDHRHHVADDRIDCLYCHTAAESSRSAGLPSTELCMGCHAQVFSESALLEPVRRSYFSGKPLPWNRVHNVGDFAYFDHAVHVQRGLGCVTCHGAVDRMARVEKVAPLTMQWCLECHTSVEQAALGKPEELARAGLDPRWFANAPAEPARTPEYDPMRGSVFQVSVGNELTRRRPVTSLTTCSACHR